MTRILDSMKQPKYPVQFHRKHQHSSPPHFFETTRFRPYQAIPCDRRTRRSEAAYATNAIHRVLHQSLSTMFIAPVMRLYLHLSLSTPSPSSSPRARRYSRVDCSHQPIRQEPSTGNQSVMCCSRYSRSSRIIAPCRSESKALFGSDQHSAS
jgi:hypothetical protein